MSACQLCLITCSTPGTVQSSQCVSVQDRLSAPGCKPCTPVPNAVFTQFSSCAFQCNVGYMKVNESSCVACNKSMCDVGYSMSCTSSLLRCNPCEALAPTSMKEYVCRGDCTSSCIACKAGSANVGGNCIPNAQVPANTPTPTATGTNMTVVYPQRSRAHSGDSSTPWFIG